jgi:hypothetical protein
MAIAHRAMVAKSSTPTTVSARCGASLDAVKPSHWALCWQAYLAVAHLGEARVCVPVREIGRVLARTTVAPVDLYRGSGSLCRATRIGVGSDSDSSLAVLKRLVHCHDTREIGISPLAVERVRGKPGSVGQYRPIHSTGLGCPNIHSYTRTKGFNFVGSPPSRRGHSPRYQRLRPPSSARVPFHRRVRRREQRRTCEQESAASQQRIL